MTPCPFCAGPPRATYTGAGKKHRYYIICTICLARTRDCTTLTEAWSRWNERTH